MKKGINEFELNKNIKNKIKIPSTQQVLKKYYNKDYFREYYHRKKAVEILQ